MISPAAIVSVLPVAVAVDEPSLYHFIVPALVNALPVNSVAPLNTLAVSVVTISVFLKIVPLDEMIAILKASAPLAPLVPFLDTE